MRRRTSVWARLAAAIIGIVLLAVAAIPTIGLAALFTVNLGPSSPSPRTASGVPIGASLTPRPSPSGGAKASPSGLVARPDASPSPQATPDPDATPDPNATPDPDATPEPTAAPSPTPVAGPTKVNLGGRKAFVSQATDKWCASAALQIAINMIVSNPDTSTNFQRTLQNDASSYTAKADSRNGGWGPSGMADALTYYSGQSYELQIFDTRADALRAAAAAIARTRNPAILLAWRGAHAWVMSGYKSDGDPFGSAPWKVTGAYILDPWYPRVSSIWGASKAPAAFHDVADLTRNFLKWKRPEGAYPERDGKFLVIVPLVDG